MPNSREVVKRLNSLLAQNWRHQFILVLIFLFPILAASLKSAASTIFVLLVLFSLSYCKQGWQQLNQQEKRLLMGFILFFLMTILSLFMTDDLRVGFKRLERYMRLVLLIPIYLMLRTEEIETGNAFLCGAFIAMFLMAGQAHYQVNMLNKLVAYGAYHKIIFGDLAVLFATIVFMGMLIYGKTILHYILCLFSVSAGLYAALLSVTRAAWLFIPLIIVSLLCLYRRRISKKGKRLVLIGIVIGGLCTAIYQPERLVEGFEQGWLDLSTFSEKSSDTSWGTRLVMWQNSFLIFKESPLLGTGTGDFHNASKKLDERGLSFKNSYALTSIHPHSIYFQLLAEGGGLGLLALIVVLFVSPTIFLYDLWKNSSDQCLHFFSISGLIAVIAFAWFGISESWLARNVLVTSYCLTMLVFITSAVNRSQKILGQGFSLGDSPNYKEGCPR